MEARTELLARPPGARSRVRSGARTTRLRVLVRLGILAIATIAAYQYSLITLLRDLTGQSPIGYLTLVPLLSIALAVRTARQPIREPAIHDRYTDYIVGLPLLAGALWMTTMLPVQLSLFYWTWRLDLLSLPLFVAGAIAITFGLRALWRYRLSVAALLLAWPVPDAWLIRHLPASIGASVIIAFGATGLVATGALLAIGWRFGQRISMVSRHSDHSLAVPRAWTAVVFVLLVGGTIAVSDAAMARYQPALSDTGDSRLAPLDVRAAQLQGWSLWAHVGSSSDRLSAGAPITWDRYTQARGPRLPTTGPAASAVSLDVFSAADLHALAGYPLDVLYRFHGYQLLDRHRVDLGAGVIAQAVVYADPTGATQWTAIYWDWPVQSGDRASFQRVVLNQRTAVISDPPSASRPDAQATRELIEAARSIVAAELSSASTGNGR